ncbi:MAG: alpha-ketoglutarate-dependent dioxygenase AlkB [Bdellovibrionales bacterium]|nr:alpha-ketoglutarate-dependent dioxygenase AlkB [Bdellovibrionales bacterium]
MSDSNIFDNHGQARLIESFYESDIAAQLQKLLMNEIPWSERSIQLFGKKILQPRLMCWMGDDGCSYKYSGTVFEPTPWTTTVLSIKQKIESYTENNFNSALLNLYRNENDSMGAHSDDEKELGDKPIIASLSLGAERPFIFRHKASKEKIKLNLSPGSLLIMSGDTQKHWKHEIPKLKIPLEPRINITFRKILL